MVTESELTQFLKKNPPAKQFVPYCHLSREADTLTVYFEGDADYSKRLSEHVTLYLSLETHEIVGCRIKGVSGLLVPHPSSIDGCCKSLSPSGFLVEGATNARHSAQGEVPGYVDRRRA
jgi:hypothetical protein